MPETFSVRSERAGRVERLTPTGELDIASVPILEAEFAAVSIGPDSVVVLDLTELTFMDSTGLHLLLRLSERLPRQLRVINGSPSVERLLDLSGARDRLPIISKTTDPLTPLQ
jgi:anti-sigma B factor antagonist